MIDKDTNKIWITVNYTVNLGNFEFIKIEGGCSRSYEEGIDDPLEVIGSLTDDILELITEKGEDARETLDPSITVE